MSAVPAGIFRAYDIRGIVGDDVNSDVFRRIGQAYGTLVSRSGGSRVVVGRDGRLSSPELASAFAAGVNDAGCAVLDAGLVPTPMLYFGIHHLEADGGVAVTASHNPGDYNGLKLCLGTRTLFGDDIQALRQAIEASDESDNTLLIFTGDNGGIPTHGGNNVPLRGTKFQTYEGGVRVPAAVRWPAKFKSPRVIKETLAYIDVWPTLAKLVGADAGKTVIDGEDMMPRWNSSSAGWDRTLYLRQGSVIHEEWKLVADKRECDDPASCGKLFNIREDPYEKNDLAQTMPDKVNELDELVDYFKSLGGPAFESKFKSEIWPPENWELSEEPR